MLFLIDQMLMQPCIFLTPFVLCFCFSIYMKNKLICRDFSSYIIKNIFLFDVFNFNYVKKILFRERSKTKFMTSLCHAPETLVLKFLIHLPCHLISVDKAWTNSSTSLAQTCGTITHLHLHFCLQTLIFP